MSIIRTWILSIFAAAIMLSVLNSMTPKGTVQMLGRCVGGLAMIAIFLGPLLDLDVNDFTWGAASDASAQINELILQYEEKNTEDLKNIIEEKTGAYILDKAKSLGQECEVTVTTKERDGVPYPEEVVLTIPYDAELSRYITEEIGIDADHQFWRL